MLSKDYKYELPNIREGIKLLMNNPTLILKTENNRDYNYESEIRIDEYSGYIEEVVFERNDYDEEYYYKIYSVNALSNNSCWISGYDRENFYFICNQIMYQGIESIKNLDFIYKIMINLLEIESESNLIEYLKSVYWMFLKVMIDDDNILTKQQKSYLDDLLYQ